GTGMAIGDFNRDGFLELLIAHGERTAQPLSLYQVVPNDNHWIRVMPLTAQGAPARGAVVTLVTEQRIQRRAINAGSGYLCQMEPVAHFGLGSQTQITRIQVRWLDGRQVTIEAPTLDQFLRVPYPNSNP
ncbi:MAG: ASPIC/UnbV domain-containing protein, partial [Leptolyngbyaceae cyanobacterium bins.59]|nr:ASPIC/UnbV domain-containing protein [Leptolyngbyaceae cyanobacterium bins.59]